MSKQAKRGRGKRPREETTSSSFGPLTRSPIGYPTAPSLASSDGRYGETTSTGTLHRSLPAESKGPGVPKIAIPALKTSTGLDSLRQFKKGRTKHACDHCRKTKSACTGGEPCARCKAASQRCVYGDGKRDKDRKRLTQLSRDASILNRHNSDICNALRQITLDKTMDPDKMRDELDKVLAMKYADLSRDFDDNRSLKSFKTGRSTSEEEEEEDDDDESASSPEMLDKGSRIAGNSQTSSRNAWTGQSGRSGRSEAGSQGRTRQVPGAQDFSRTMTLVSYHTEESDVNYVDISSLKVFDWPEPAVADALLDSYFMYVHPAAPLLNQQSFMKKYREFPRQKDYFPPNNFDQEDLVFLGTLNMVWAISSVHASLTKDIPGLEANEHVMFLARAKKLCLETGGGRGILYENARVDTTCALGLHCLYFIATCSLDKAFTFCAMAMCHAVSLNLHLRNESTPYPYREYLSCLWWSLYSLECLLNGLKGRPSCISDRDISVSMPGNLNIGNMYPHHGMYESMDDVLGSTSQSPRSSRPSRGPSLADMQITQSILQPGLTKFAATPSTSSPIYFASRIQLCKISHEMFTQLYCAAIGTIQWSKVQVLIQDLEHKRQLWHSSLPRELNIDFTIWREPNWSSPNVQQAMGLAIEDCYLRIVLFRPCLCRFGERVSLVDQVSQKFNQNAVVSCVKAATDLIQILSTPGRSGRSLYAFTPWWTILHYLCEALSVLLLELAFQSRQAPHQTPYTLAPVKKGIIWLSIMSERSISARKAWEIYDCLIRHIVPTIGWTTHPTSDLPTMAPVPPTYRTNPSLPTTSSFIPAHHDASIVAWQQHESRFDLRVFEGFSPGYEGLEGNRGMVANPLDHGLALEKFATQVTLHGQYDEGWRDLFRATPGGREMGMPFDGVSGGFDAMEVIGGGF